MRNWIFNHQARQWDRYKAFYWENGIFTEFETGELVIKGMPKPYQRRLSEKYGLEICSSRDTGALKLFFDAECTQPVPRSWLNYNNAHNYAVDTTTGRAYAFGKYNHSHARHLWGYMHWSRHDHQPAYNGLFEMNFADRGLRKEFYPIFKEAKKAAMAIVRLNKEYASATNDGTPFRPFLNQLRLSPKELLDSVFKRDAHIADYSWYTRDMVRLAYNGCASPINARECSVLFTNGERYGL